jgi:hypothetical protein
MANPLNGEVQFKALGKDWTFRLGINELIELATSWGLKPEEGEKLWEMVGGAKSPSQLRDVMFYGLKRAQPEITPEQAGDVLSDLTIPAFGSDGVLQRGLRWAIPAPEDSGGPKGKGKAGTGPRS